jgi:O-antigen/teichoic acid export membrane protein
LSERRQRHFAFARLLSSAVVSQALLSAASFAIGMLLIRNTADIDYSYFILASNAILLLISLQNAFFNPPLAIRMNLLDRVGRADLIGELYREQRRVLPLFGGVAIVVASGLWFEGVLNARSGPLVLVTVIAALAVAHREYFRMVLFAQRRAFDVLRADTCYALLAVTGAVCAIWTRVPEVSAVVALFVAALASGLFLARTLRQHEPWNVMARRGILRDIAPLAGWSTAGAAIHWTFNQGYIYLVAGTLDVSAVAAVAATRLLLMPVNLLSSGIGSLMLPLTAKWLHQHGAPTVWRRLWLLAGGLALTTIVYFAVLWVARDWIFSVFMRKRFAQGDLLLLLWGAIFLLIVVRDQVAYLLAAQGRFRGLTLLTLCSAFTALTISYCAMLRIGVAGALVGIMVGEFINIIGVVALSVRPAEFAEGVPTLNALPRT